MMAEPQLTNRLAWWLERGAVAAAVGLAYLCGRWFL